MKGKFILFLGLVIFLSGCMGRAAREFFKEEHLQISAETYISIGWGGNSGILELEDTVIIIDTKIEKKAEEFYKSIESKLEGKKIVIVNTHLHSEHTAGNYLYNAKKIYIPNYSNEVWNEENKEINYIDKLPYFKVEEEIVIKNNENVVRIIPVGNAHTLNDLIVYFENEKIMFVGDLFFNKYHPVVMVGADISEWMSIIYSIIEKYDIKSIVPGHGPIAEVENFKEQADYFKDILNNKNDKNKLRQIKKKYKHFDNIPNHANFRKVVGYVK